MRLLGLATKFLALFLLAFTAQTTPAATIETIAGTGHASDGGDSGPALEINIGNPFGVEIGPDGELIICEVDNHRVRRLDLATGQLSTIAGVGQKGYSGDGGPATKARLNEPYEARFDRAGNLYFVEMRNHLVRRVDARTGIISTVAGTGEAGYGGDGGPAVRARLNQPHSIALDDEDGLYIADIGNHRIRRVDLRSALIDSIAGNGERTLPREGQSARDQPILGPRALFFSPGTMWIALREGHSVWRLDMAKGTLHHAAGVGKPGYHGDGGPARDASFNGPKGIALEAGGSVYVADTENQAIRKIDPSSGIITTVAGAGPTARGPGGDGGPAAAASLNRPHGVCVDGNGSLYIGDSENHRVRRVTFNTSQPAGGALDGQRPRVIVSTDVGGSDPDDFQSMVHLLVYADVLDLEGLISSPPGKGRAADIHEVLDAYASDYDQLEKSNAKYPTPDALRAVTRQGAVDPAPASGFHHPTEGSRWIIERAQAHEARPLWVLVWGSLTDVAQAVHDAPQIKQSLRVYSIGSWNTRHDEAARHYLYNHHADLWWIEADTTFRGMYVGGDQSDDLGNRTFLARHVAGHGALGDLLMQKKDLLKMGDTPSLLYLLRGDPHDPTADHWGGAFRPTRHGEHYWHDSADPSLTEDSFHGARTVNRWRADYLNDWRRRMDRLQGEQ